MSSNLHIYETTSGFILARHDADRGQYTCGVTAAYSRQHGVHMAFAGTPEVLATLGGVRVHRSLAAARARLAEINAPIEPYDGEAS
jgi:hypothetical protein